MPDPESTYVTGSPSPALAALVEGYMGYRLVGFEPGLHRGLPSRHLTFIVSIGPEIDVTAQTDPAQGPRRYRGVLSGLTASSAHISHDGNQEGVAIELSALGTRALFGMPASAIWNTSLELSEVTGPVGDELWERLQGSEGWPERFAICDEVLAQLAGDWAIAPEVLRAWDVIVRSGGTTPVNQVAADVGWSRQHLARRFAGEFGLRPKLAARVVRFERARRMLQQTPSFVGIAEVAATCGYYDQAHLDRDFAELAGCAPSQWLREELPLFQDDHLLDLSR